MSWIHKLFLGVDPEDDRKAMEEADRRLAALNESKRAVNGEDWWQETQLNIEKGRIPDPVGDVNQTFSDAVTEETGDLLQKTVSFVIPWQAWVLLVGFLFIYAGGVRQLKRA